MLASLRIGIWRCKPESTKMGNAVVIDAVLANIAPCAHSLDQLADELT
jgi:hypothetical protein